MASPIIPQGLKEKKDLGFFWLMCSLIGSVNVKEMGADLKPWAQEREERGASAVLLIHVAFSWTRDYLKGCHLRARGEETVVSRCARPKLFGCFPIVL